MLKTILLVISALALARAQLPQLGRCTDTVPMTDFDMGKFFGKWYEAEKSYQIGSEFGSRCAMAIFSRGSDKKYYMDNLSAIRFFGLQRHTQGEILLPSSKAEAGKFNIRYNGVQLNSPSNLYVLHTDYKNYAVLWNCNNIGPLHTANVWIMTRDPNPSSETLQEAYGILDKHKITATLERTEHTDCKYTSELVEGLLQSVGATTPEGPIEEAPDKYRSTVDLTKSESSKTSIDESVKEVISNSSIEKKKQSLNVDEIILKNADNVNDEIANVSKKVIIDEHTVNVPKVEPIVVPVKPLKTTAHESSAALQLGAEQNIKS